MKNFPVKSSPAHGISTNVKKRQVNNLPFLLKGNYMKKIFLAALIITVVLCVSSCEPPEKPESETTTTTSLTSETTTAQTSEEAVSETTTGRIGGFIIEEMAPGGDIQW